MAISIKITKVYWWVPLNIGCLTLPYAIDLKICDICRAREIWIRLFWAVFLFEVLGQAEQVKMGS